MFQYLWRSLDYKGRIGHPGCDSHDEWMSPEMAKWLAKPRREASVYIPVGLTQNDSEYQDPRPHLNKVLRLSFYDILTWSNDSILFNSGESVSCPIMCSQLTDTVPLLWGLYLVYWVYIRNWLVIFSDRSDNKCQNLAQTDKILIWSACCLSLGTDTNYWMENLSRLANQSVMIVSDRLALCITSHPIRLLRLVFR